MQSEKLKVKGEKLNVKSDNVEGKCFWVGTDDMGMMRLFYTEIK